MAKITPVHATCPNCKKAMFTFASKCPECGADVSNVKWPKPETPEKKK